MARRDRKERLDSARQQAVQATQQRIAAESDLADAKELVAPLITRQPDRLAERLHQMFQKSRFGDT